MPNLSLNALARGPVRIREEIPVADPAWDGVDVDLRAPVRVELEASPVGEGVLVRGTIAAEAMAECRRCLRPVTVRVDDTVDLLYEPLSADEEVELGGEVYPLPDRGDDLDLTPALREQLLLRIPDFVVCDEACRGICPRCGADLNRTTCACEPEAGEGPWDALKKIRFD